MMNLFEMMANAQGGNAVTNMARQFGLQPTQAQAAMEALLPAFSTGMQRQAQTAEGLENLMRMFGAGQFAGLHDANGDGIPDTATTEGNDILGQLFGGKDVSRAVAAHAAAASGVSDAILKQMLPVMASLLMGGLFKSAMGNGLGGLLGQVMQGGLGNMFGGATAGAAPPPSRSSGNPMGDLLGNFFANMPGAQPPQPASPPDPMTAGIDMLKGMFQSGRQVQQAQMDGIEQIFEQFTRRR